VAYQQAYNWLVGATLSKACSADSGSTWTCGITRSGGYQGLVVWNPSKSVSFTAPSQYTQARDIYGATSAVPTNGVVNVSFKPILLETSEAAPPPPPPPPPPASATDFTFAAASSAALTISAGKPASVMLNITPQGGAFNNAIQIACSGMPTGTSCALSPTSVTPGANTVTTTLTISANAAQASAKAQHHFALAIWMPLFGVTLIGVGNWRTRKMFLGLIVIAALAACVACSGVTSSNAAKPPTTTPETPATPSTPQSHTMTVTATSGTIQHSVAVPFTLQ
jgi:hypothetical protein